MQVKGVAYLAREDLMKKEFGTERWGRFLDQQRAKRKFLAQAIFPVTRIDVDEFLGFNDDLVAAFYEGDRNAYWRFGEHAGEYALANQMKGLFKPGEERKFLMTTPTIYKTYFDGGEITTDVDATGISVGINNTPPHVYFEFSVIGFAKRGMHVLKAKHPDPVLVRATPWGTTGSSTAGHSELVKAGEEYSAPAQATGVWSTCSAARTASLAVGLRSGTALSEGAAPCPWPPNTPRSSKRLKFLACRTASAASSSS